MSRINLSESEAGGLQMLSGRFGVQRRASGPISSLLAPVVSVDTNGMDQTIVLPALKEGLFFYVLNTGTSGEVIVNSATGSRVAAVAGGDLATFICDGRVWSVANAGAVAPEVFDPSGPGASEGLVPKPPLTAGNTLFLREDGLWALPTGVTGFNAYSFMSDGTGTAAGNGPDTFRFRSSDASVTMAITADEVGFGDNLNLRVNPATVNHDLLLGYVPDKHVAHSAVSVVAGAGLTGGGTIAATRTLALDILGTAPGAAPALPDLFLFWDTSASLLSSGTLSALNVTLDHNALLGYVADEHVAHSAVSVSGGTGLAGGGNLTTSRVLSLDVHGLSDGSPGLMSDEVVVYRPGTGQHLKVTGALLGAMPTQYIKGRASPGTGVVEDLTPISTAAIISVQKNLKRDYGMSFVSGEDNTEAWQRAMDDVKNDRVRWLEMWEGITQVNTTLEVLGSDWSLIGPGADACLLRMATTAGNNGTFFQFGRGYNYPGTGDAINVRHVSMSGFTTNCNNRSATLSGAVFRLLNCDELRFQDIECNSTAGFMEIGHPSVVEPIQPGNPGYIEPGNPGYPATQRVGVNKLKVIRCTGETWADCGAPVVYVREASGYHFLQCEFGPSQGGTPASGIRGLLVRPSSNGNTDGGYFLDTNFNSGKTQVLNRNIELDATNGEIGSMFFDQCNFDFASKSNVYIHVDSPPGEGVTPKIRVDFTACRGNTTNVDSSGTGALQIDNSGNGIMRVAWLGGVLGVKDGPAVEIKGNNPVRFLLRDAGLEDSGGEVPRPVIRVTGTASGFSIQGCHAGSRDPAVPPVWTYGVEYQGNSQGSMVTGNDFSKCTKGIIHPGTAGAGISVANIFRHLFANNVGPFGDELPAKLVTSSTTPTTVTLGQALISDDRVCFVTVKVQAWQAGDAATWTLSAAVRKVAGSNCEFMGTVGAPGAAVIDTAFKAKTAATSAFASGNAALDVSTNSVRIRISPPNATMTYWSASLKLESVGVWP